MTEGIVQRGAGAPQGYSSGMGGGQSANLGDILERVLDKGLVIAGDIRVNLLDIELLTIKLRLVIASLETAREVGINWWENDPWFSAQGADRAHLADENRQLRERLAELERGNGSHRGHEIGAPQRGAGQGTRDDD
jgi:gas vesicle protein GvpA/GvpJ/GvpM family